MPRVESPTLDGLVEQTRSRLAAAARLEDVFAARRFVQETAAQERGVLARAQGKLADDGHLVAGALAQAAKRVKGTSRGIVRSVDASLKASEADIAQSQKRLAQQSRQALQLATKAVVDTVERYAKLAPPSVRLALRPAGGSQRILHWLRPSDDDAVLFQWLFGGKAPSRYDALFDDSVDKVGEPPRAAYDDELEHALLDTPERLRQALRSPSPIVPFKGQVAGEVTVSGKKRVVRWVQRGPVVEAELEVDGAFRNVLTETQAQAILARLLALKLEGRLALEFIES